jgi:hypothetical protein
MYRSNIELFIKVISTYSMHSCRNHTTINHLLISTTARKGEGGGVGWLFMGMNNEKRWGFNN